jgi:hypothetical protein
MGDGRPRNHKRYVTDEDHGVVANLERARLPLVFSLAPKKDPVPFWRAVDDLGSAFSQLQHLLMADETSNAIGVDDIERAGLSDEAGHITIGDLGGQAEKQALQKVESLNCRMVVESFRSGSLE